MQNQNYRPSPHDPANHDFTLALSSFLNVSTNMKNLTPQEEEWAKQLAQEGEFKDLSLDEILDVIRNNPGGGNIGFYRDRLRAYRSLRNRLQKKYAGQIAPEIVADLILNNPNLSIKEYDLLMEYYKQQQPDQLPYDLVAVIQAHDGSVLILTYAQLAHIHERHDKEFGNPSDADLIDLLKRLLQRKPDEMYNNTWVYKNVSVRVGNRTVKKTVRIAIDKGKIITTFDPNN